MLAYHGDEKLKTAVINEMIAHRKADQLVKGHYWQDGKGCAVGCIAKTEDEPHKVFEERLGIPEHLAQLEDEIFENLQNGKAMLWPEKFLTAFKVGRDYTKVWHHFAVWLLIDPEFGVIRYANKQGKVAIRNVAKLHQKVIDGVTPRQKSWDAGAAARDAARAAAGDAGAAARDAARAAARAAAGDAGDAGAAARDAARAAARAAGDAWAAWDTGAAAGDAAYKRMADKLIELIRAV